MEDSLLDELGATTQVVLATSTGKILLGTDEGLFQFDPNLKLLSDLDLGKVRVNKLFQSRGGIAKPI
jgi:hypothetical protein